MIYLEAFFSSCQFALFNPNNAKIVSGLNVSWLTLQDPQVAAFGKVEIPDVVGVDVS